MDVAPTACTAFSHDHALSLMREVCDELSCCAILFRVFPHLRPHRHFEDEVLPAAPMHLRPLAMGAPSGLEMMLEAEIYQR